MGSGPLTMPELLATVLLGGGLAFAAAIQPGPLQVFLMARAVAAGWKRTLPACLAPLLSDGPIALLAVLVLGRLPGAAQSALRAGGGLLLLYLAAVALKQWRRPATAPVEVTAPRSLLEAAGVNLLNPNPYLAWALVLGPAVVAAWDRRPLYAVGLVVAFYATMLATLAGFVFLAGTARFLGTRAQRALVVGSALVLAALGVLLLVAGTRQLWAG
jgi:threonine/homoserine/homoserine lactone efflux protein